MSHKNLLPQMIGLLVVVLLLVGCGATEPAAVQRVRAFQEAINTIEPGEKTEDGMVEVGKGFSTLTDIFEEHTTTSGLPMNPLILAMTSGMIRFSNVEYELVSESAECAVVKATGDMMIGEETKAFNEEYAVMKQGEKWLINLGDKSCD